MNTKEQGFLENGSFISNNDGKIFCFWHWIKPKEMSHIDFMLSPNKKAMIYEYDDPHTELEVNIDDFNIVSDPD